MDHGFAISWQYGKDVVLKKIFAITAAGLFVASMATSAAADCGHDLKVTAGEKGPMTTAMDTKPSTPKPATTKSGS